MVPSSGSAAPDAAIRSPILVFGATGQLGWELVRALTPLGPIVAAHRARVDFTDLGALTDCVRHVAPRAVVNAAAYTDVDGAEREPALARRVNADAPRALAAASAELGVPFVHYSTDYVFDGTATSPYAEDAATAPLGVYGRTKRDGELAVADVGGPHLIVRTSWVYGVRGRNFLRAMLRLAHTRAELRVVADQRGAPTWSRALAGATACILAQLADVDGALTLDAARSGVYHITADGETTWFEFARAILAADPDHGVQMCRSVEPVTTAAYGAAVARPAYSVLACERARRTFAVRLPDWRVQLALVMDELAERRSLARAG
ncbi:MAG TPA: dTDP-4-dehydrorhamnose reductase [Gemmatirosa sp.]